MAYSWNTKPNTSTTPKSYSWSTPEGRQYVEQSASFVRSNPAPTLGQKLISGVNTGYDSSIVVPKSFRSAFLTDAPAKIAWETWSGTISDTAKRFNNVVDTFKGDSTKLEKGISVGKAGLGIVNTIFAPITAGINMLTPIPGVGHVADKVNQFFGAVAGGSGAAAVEGLYAMPLEEGTKKKLEPLVSEVAGLAGMIIAGRAGGKAYGELKTKTNTILESVKNEINPTRQLPVRTETKTTAPQTEVVTPTTKYSWSEEPKPADYTTFKSETNLKLQQEAQARGIVFDADIPVQTRMSMIENLKMAEQIVKTDAAKAERFLMREEPLPVGVEVGSIYKALKQKALTEGDAGLVERLSRTTAGTESARALKSFDEGVKLNADPVEALAEVRQARLSAAIGREKGITIEKAVKETKAKVGKILKPDKATWDDFIKSLTC